MGRSTESQQECTKQAQNRSYLADSLKNINRFSVNTFVAVSPTKAQITMPAFKANLINALVLIVFGSWAYLNMATESRSMTVLIPVFFGVVLASLTPSIKKENKIAAHVGVLLTALIAVALIMPLMGSINREDMLAVFRVGTMMLFSIFSLAIFVKSFIEIRKARQQT